MDLRVLGCRAGMPAGGEPSSGYLVTTAGARVLLDCGPGVATALSGYGGARGLTAVAVTHLHLDHCYDLLPIGKSLLYAGVERVPLFVPEGARAVLDRLASLFPVGSDPRGARLAASASAQPAPAVGRSARLAASASAKPAPAVGRLDRAFDDAFDVREYRPGARVLVGDCELGFHELRHAVPSCGVRVAASTGVLAYTADTGVTDGLLPLAEGADLLLAEATLDRPDTTDHGHLSGADAGRLAGAAKVGQLVLTHFTSMDPAWTAARRDDARRHYAGPVLVAKPAAVFPVCDGTY